MRIAPNEITCSDPNAIKRIYPTQKGLDKTDFYPVWNVRLDCKHKVLSNVSAKELTEKQRVSTKTDSETCKHLTGCITVLTNNHSLFAMTSDRAHHEARRVVSHVYSLTNVLKSETYIDKCSELFLIRLKEHSEEAESVIDLGRWLQMYAYDVIGELYFGNMFGFLEHSHDQGGWIASLDLLMPFICVSGVAPLVLRPLILASSVFIPAARKALKAFQDIGIATRKCVATRFDQDDITRSEAATSRRTDIMQQLHDIHINEDSKIQLEIGDVEQEAYAALLAGSDTTATGFRSIFYHLMKNPEVYRQVQEEIDEAFLEGRLSEPVKFSEAIKLPLLCATIKEAFRIYPGIQLSMGRIVPTEGMELHGRFIPGGYWVGMNAAVVQFDTSIFGHDAYEFRPARWLEPNATHMDKHMLIFGAGTRTCIGKNISLAELHKLTPAILRNFDLKLVEENSCWKTRNCNICKQDMGLVRLRKRRV